jgi:hypothetical protein
MATTKASTHNIQHEKYERGKRLPDIRFIVRGPTSWDNERVVDRKLAQLAGRFGSGRLLMIHGGMAGLDIRAASIARQRGIHTVAVPALWDIYNHDAERVRDAVMLQLEPRFVVAFYWSLRDNKEVRDMIIRAKRAQVKVLPVKVGPKVGMMAADEWDKMQEAKKAKRRRKKRRA